MALETSLERKRRLRWWTLATLSVSLLVVIIDDTVVNVAIPTFQRELGASNSAIQWIVDGYILVFAGLLLTMGTLGDRFGRKRLLQLGLVVFVAASTFAAFAGSTGMLIAARALMGVGGAMIMPATLAVLVDVFPREERVKAISIWTGIASLGIPLGPLVGGWLIERFWWGSVFLVNLPIVAVALVLGAYLVPESRDPNPPQVDRLGAVLSTAALGALLAGIIQAPEQGWSDPAILGWFTLAAVAGFLFVRHELGSPAPMLDVRLFLRVRFGWGTVAIAVSFLAIAGLVFNLTQYLQLVKGYSAFEAGLRTIPLAVGFGLGGQITQRLVARMGPRATIAAGLVLVAGVLAAFTAVGISTPYWLVALDLLGAGIAVGMAAIPATDWVMGSVPEEQAGVGSAANDVSRQLGAALGVAVLGSVMSASFADGVGPVARALPPEAAATAGDSLGAALQVAGRLGGDAGRALADAATGGFVDGYAAAMWVAAMIAGAAGLLVALHAREPWVEPAAAPEFEPELEAA